MLDQVRVELVEPDAETLQARTRGFETRAAGLGRKLASILLQGPDERLEVAGRVLQDVQPVPQRVERDRGPGLTASGR
jgi:hypothetical protein